MNSGQQRARDSKGYLKKYIYAHFRNFTQNDNKVWTIKKVEKKRKVPFFSSSFFIPETYIFFGKFDLSMNSGQQRAGDY